MRTIAERITFTCVAAGALAVVSCGGDTPTQPVNHPPHIEQPRLSLFHDETYEQVISASDADGDSVTVRVPARPAWLSFDSATLVLSGAPGEQNIGVHDMVVTASDGTATTTDSFQITVSLAPCLRRAVFGAPPASEYVLPFNVGDSVEVLQTYCGPGNHNRDNQLAYDFRMPFATPVAVARAGIVGTVVANWLDSDKDDSHFNYVMIWHGDATFAFYAHLKHESVLVEEGARVAQGQIIAAAGESGTPTLCSSFEECAVLHFGVYKTGRVIDLPINFRNAGGPVDERGGLVEGASYTVLPYVPASSQGR